MQSKVKNFRFTEVMCSDLDRLATIWKCTATEAVARALTQAVTVEDWKAYQSAQHENFSLDEEKISPAEQQQPEPDRAEDSTQTVTTIAADAARTVLIFKGSTSTPAIAYGVYLPKSRAVATATINIPVSPNV